MFVDTIPNRGSRPTILIRHSYREGRRVKKRTLANITNLPPETVGKIRAVLKGAVLADAPGGRLDGAFAIPRPHGNAVAVLAALRACGIEQAIAARRSPKRDLAAAMVAQRILEPGSKLAAARSFRPETAASTLASQLGLPESVGEDRLYEAMDWLLERQPRIERALAERHLAEGSPVLYDPASTWTYSRKCRLARRGCSRDGRRGLPRIEFGLLCDGEGRPVAVEAFPGNAADPSAAASQVGKLRDRFGLEPELYAIECSSFPFAARRFVDSYLPAAGNIFAGSPPSNSNALRAPALGEDLHWRAIRNRESPVRRRPLHEHPDVDRFQRGDPVEARRSQLLAD